MNWIFSATWFAMLQGRLWIPSDGVCAWVGLMHSV